MFSAISDLENASPKGKIAARDHACAVAQETLRVAGFDGLRGVLSVYAEHFAVRLPKGYEMATALALETLAVHFYGREDAKKDIAVQFLDRAAAIAPHDLQIVRSFSERALAIKPEDLLNLRHDSDRQRKTVVGMHNRAKSAIATLFSEVYKMPRAMLVEAPAGKLVEHLARCGVADPREVFSLLSNYCELSMELALFFKSNPARIAAFGSSVQLLELLGYQQPVSKQLREVRNKVDAFPRDAAFEADIPLLKEALRRFAESAGCLSRRPKGEKLKVFHQHANQLLVCLGGDTKE